MTTYIFRTKTYLDYYTTDIGLIKDMEICADSIHAALARYAKDIKNKHFVDIIDIDNGEPIYGDPMNSMKQTGWIFKAEHETFDEKVNTVTEDMELHISVYIFADFED